MNTVEAGFHYCDTRPSEYLRRKSRASFKKVVEVVASRGGQILSQYTGTFKAIRVACGKGHDWSPLPANLNKGAWCPYCDKQRVWGGPLKRLAAHCESLGGKLLSTEYVNAHTKVTVQCAKEHIWDVSPLSLTGLGTWCGLCAGKETDHPEGFAGRFRDLAKSRGFKVTTPYRGHSKPIGLECSLGHLWKTSPGHIVGGTGCPDCHKKKRLERAKETKLKLEWRKKNDPQYILAKAIRTRIGVALKHRRTQKQWSAVEELGCSIPELVSYIESKFQPGMTWQNYGIFGWHIDHIRPLVSFDLSNQEQYQQACHYTNLQPLWAKDNLSKSDKWEQS